MARTPNLHIFEGKDGWYWHLKSANGKIVAVGGESFVRKKNAMRSSEGVLTAFADPISIHIEDEDWEVRTGHYLFIYKGEDGWRWNMKAGNHKIIAHSGEVFSKRGNAIRAVHTFCKVSSQPVSITWET